VPDVIAFDTETALIEPGLLAPPFVCLSLAHESGVELVHRTDARPWFEALLDSDCLLVGHNAAFDFGVAAAAWPDLLSAIFDKYERGEVTDTMLRQKLIDIASTSRIRGRYSLEEIARRRLGRHLEKDTWRKRYGELYDVPLSLWPKGAKQYPIEDARTTLDVYVDQENHNALLQDQYRQARAAWWLHLMSAWGLRTDAAGVEALSKELHARYHEAEARLQAIGLVRDNGTRDTKAAAAYMIEACEKRNALVRRTAKGNVRLDADTCELVGDPVLDDYAEISGLKKKISTDLALLHRGVSVPIQARFDTLLETGRTSSSPNVQNQQRKGGFRECFVPRDRWLYGAADYSQFELRTVAQVMLYTKACERSLLAEALNAGFDPHLEVARRIVGCSYAEAVAALADGDEEIDSARQTGKVANFGFPGGLGITRFVHFARKQYGVTLTEDEARALKRHWITTWPEFVGYFESIGQQCENGPARIEQIFTKRYRGGCSFTEAANSLFQGLAADAAKRAGFLIAKACYVDEASPLFGCRPVNFVHDEFIVEVPDDERASAAANEIARLMVRGASIFLPDVPPLAEPYLMRRWSKKAKPLHNDRGELVPWDAAA